MHEILFYCGSIFILLSLILLSAVISSAEVAFFSLSHKQLIFCKESKDKNHRKIYDLVSGGEHLLATILIFNNLINITFFVYSSYIMWQYFGKDNMNQISKIIHTLFSSIFLVLFAEFIPKMYANNNNLLLAKKYVSFINLLMKIGKPISSILIKMGGILGKEFPKEKVVLSSDKLNEALKLSVANTIDQEELLESIISFGSLLSKQVMKNRSEIAAIDVENNFEEVLKIINNTGYSRLPVFENSIDNIKGTIYTKDLLTHLDKDIKFKWQKYLKDAFFIPETKKLDSLLLDFKEKKIHIAIVVDEYGGTSGLITMEDLLEKIIGSMKDNEFNTNFLYKKIDQFTYIFEGKINIESFCKIINSNIDYFKDVKKDAETLAGLVLELHGEFPKLNDKIIYKKCKFTITELGDRRIKKIKVNINSKTFN